MRISRTSAIVAMTAAVALAMGLSLANGFVYDDFPAIVRNSRVINPAEWHTIPGAPYWLGTLWRPLTVAMFALQWSIGHGSAWLFHLVSLAAYLGVGVMLWRLLLRCGVPELAAAAAGVLFLVHPTHVEVVANGVGQAELWSTLAALAATSVYLRARQQGVTGLLVLSVLIFTAAGIMSKEQGFTIPLLLAGAEWILIADRDVRPNARLRLLIPVFGLAAVLFLLRAGLLDSFTGETPAIALRQLSPAGRALTFLGTIPEYARLVIWPLHLQADYGPPGIPVGGPVTARHLLGALLLAGYVMVFVRARRRAPIVAFGLFWAAVTLAPVSNLVTASGIVMAERVMFLPTIGLAIALAGAVAQGEAAGTEEGWIRRSTPAFSRSRFLAFSLSVWGAILCIRSATRVSTWSNQEHFFSELTQDAPRAYRAWKVSGEFWDGTGDHARAIASLQHANALWPHDYEVDEHLGQYLRSDGHCDQAIPVFEHGVTLDPTASSLRAKLVECLILARNWDDAERYTRDALAAGQSEFESTASRLKRLRADTAK